VAYLLLWNARMRTRSTLLATLFALGLGPAACTPGEVGPGGDDGVDVDERPEGVLCETALTLSGSLTPPGTPPGAELGCVPEGTWTVNVTIGEGDCGDVPVNATYTYVVAGVGRDQTITYDGTEDSTLGIHAGGNGECEGTFEHLSPGDGGHNVLLLKPYFEAGSLQIVGIGQYQLWEEAP
jgi:hypothetical protein